MDNSESDTSETDTSEISAEDSIFNKSRPSIKVLDESLGIDESYIIHDATESNKEAKKSCKILKFSSKFTFEEILIQLQALKHEEYPNLFIFIIETTTIRFCRTIKTEETARSRKLKKKIKKVEKLKSILTKFSLGRPLILQLTSEDDKLTKFYYKDEQSCQFLGIDQSQRNFEAFLNFPTFLCSVLDGKFHNCLKIVLEKLSILKNSSLILRLTSLFELSGELFNKLVLQCAACGSKSDLLAVLDAPFVGGVRSLSTDAQYYLSCVINENYSNNIESDDEASLDDQYEDENSPSILSTAVENKNTEIIEYLISNCTHLIQQLPFKHQVRISTAAFTTEQLDVLCELVDISDFPFPSDFESIKTENERLKNIITNRTNFGCAIKAKDFNQISKFIDNNLSLKVVYNPANKSALKQAIDTKKYEVFYYLKSHGFQAVDIDRSKELKSSKANNYKSRQMITNVNSAIENHQISVNLLCNISFIHNKRISKDQEAEYRRKIRKWYEDINKVLFGSDLINVAASCKDLKLIFDFEDISVENASLSGPGSLGVTYPLFKWIFIGAKSPDNERDQTIKGVIAHELCHYVMKLVYENNENPYYKHWLKIIERFEAVVKVIDKWSPIDSEDQDDECDGIDSEDQDDECDGIISSVFTHYDSKDFHPELIVRVMQILTQYDDDDEKSNHLQEKYKELFNYFRIHVWPEMQNFNLKIREDVRKMNRIMELLPAVMNRKLELIDSKNVNEMINNEITIISTNVPKLLLIDMVSQLHGIYGDIFKAQNIFIDPEKLKNQEIFDDLKQLFDQNIDLNIFVDYSKEICENLENFVNKKSLKFIFIVLINSQTDKLIQMVTKKDLNQILIEVNYNWTDLTAPSQKNLLQNKLNFQNNSNCTFLDLLKIESGDNQLMRNTAATEDDDKLVQIFSEIVDSELLNLILENTPTTINVILETETDSQDFKFLFQPRDFIQQKHIKIQNKLPKTFGTSKIIKVSQQELLKQVKDKKYILISDIAGSGKSWVMKNITNTLHQTHPTKWITYVDLKQFIKEFNCQKSKPEFSNFLVDKILKLKADKFEAKLIKKMYEVGKVLILFDGFDEIAPDCAEFVSKLVQSFESNGGNQMWIATRDYFEVDLQKELENAATYKISSFTDKDGVDFIVKSWMLKDLGFMADSLIKSKDDFEKSIKTSENLKVYNQIARRIVNKVVISDTRSVGMPQLFKMIAENFKDNKNATIAIKKFIIYKTFAKKLYERWSSAKGEIRKNANTESQDYELNYQKFHQYSAIKNLFLDLLEDLFPDNDECEWCVEEVIACGLMTKIGDDYYFLHETFCEFYVADYIAGILKKKTKFNDKFCKLFARVLTIKKFEMIRVFLSDVIEDSSILAKIQGNMKKQIKYFNEMTNFHHYFSKFNEHFACFVIEVLKNGDYEKVRDILFHTAESICADTENSELFSKYQDFIINFLTVDDLKKFIQEQLTFQKFIQSSRDVKIFEDFVIKAAAKTNEEFIQNSFKLVSSDGFEENIFSFLVRSSSLDANKMDKFMEIIKKILKSSEILELIKNCNKNQENILQICIQTGDEKKLQVLWIAAEKIQNSANLREIIQMPDLMRKSILHNVRIINNIDYQETFMQLLTNSFDNKEELKDFLLQKDFNFIHDLIEKDEDPAIIELILNILKNYFTAPQFQEILLQKHKRDRNLLQMAGFKSKKLQTHQYLWQLYRDFFKDDQEFLDVIKQVDFFGNNIIQIAVYELPNEFFDFMMNELEKVPKSNEIVKILSNINKWNRNVLQSESKWTKSAELHENLWNKFRKYFKSDEILDFIKHVDKFGNHLLFNAVENNKKEFVELIWKDIKSFMSHDEQIKYLKVENNDGKNLLQMCFGNKEYFNEVYEWIQDVMAEYKIHLETMTRKKLLTEKYPVRKCCKIPKWVCKLTLIEEEI